MKKLDILEKWFAILEKKLNFSPQNFKFFGEKIKVEIFQKI